MSSLNKVMLIGNLGADPELKNTTGGRSVVSLSVATNEKFKGKDGALQEKTEWHRVTVWGETAEICAKYLTKGRTVYVEGKLQTRQYEKDGQKHYSTEIVAHQVTFLGGGERQAGGERTSEVDRPRRSGWGDPRDGGVNARQGNGAQGQSREPGSDDIPY